MISTSKRLAEPQAVHMPQTLSGLAQSLARATFAVQRMSSLIAEQQIRLRLILSCVDDGLVVMRKDGSVVIENPAGRDMIRAVCTCQTSSQPCPFHAALAEAAAGTPRWTRETKNIRMDFKTVTSETGEEQIAVRLENRTENPETSDMLTPADAIQELAAALAHEINNPLTPILGIASSVPNDSTGRRGKKLRMIGDAGRRIAGVVDDLLEFQEIHHWEGTDRLRLNALFGRVIEAVKAKKSDFTGKIVIGETPDIFLWNVNEEQVIQMLVYLVHQIVCGMNAAGTGTEISLTACVEAGEPVLVVTHDGPLSETPVFGKTGTRGPDSSHFKGLLPLFAELRAVQNGLTLKSRRTGKIQRIEIRKRACPRGGI